MATKMKVKYSNLISLALLTGRLKKKSKKPNFSNIIDIDETFIGKAPRSKEHLAMYCAAVLNTRFPHPKSKEQYCIENGHMSPLDAIWGAYSEEDPFSIWYAMRGSGKTFDLSILGWLETVFKKGCWSTVLGGSLEQSTKAVSYTSDLWELPTIKNLRSKLLVNNQVAGRGFKTTHGGRFQALAASSKSVRGPHPQKLRLDECLVGDTLIKTIDGDKKIKDITNKDIIFGWNGCKITYDIVRCLCYAGKKQTYKVYFSNGNFINCTDNHKILTTKGYLYLYEIKGRKRKGETISIIGESKNMFKMWQKNKFKKKIYNRILSRMLYKIKFKQRKEMFNLWCKNFKSIDLLSELLFSIKKRKETKMYRLWQRIKTARNSKMQSLSFKTSFKSWHVSKNGCCESDSIKKEFIESRIKNDGIIGIFQNIISNTNSLWKICFRFFMQRFKFSDRSSWRILARKKINNRKRQEKERRVRERRLQGFRIKNKIYAFLGIKNYGIYEITNIEKDKVNDVYDLNIPNIHSFMANGIIVHNCDEMEPKIYEAALGQPKQRDGILDNVIISSTLHNAFGLMSEIIDNREELGAAFYPWCIEEVLNPRGFWTKEEFSRKVRQLTIAMIDAEYKLKRPKIGDTIFDFESVDRSYQRGKNEHFQAKVFTEAGIDWGYSCTALSIVQDPREVFRNPVTKIWEYVELKERCQAIAKLCIKYNITRIYCDSNPKDSNITLSKTLKENRVGTEVYPIAFNKWKGIGINVLRFLLEKNKINITDKTAQDKVKKYHYKDPELGIIDKKDDHIPDSLISWAASRSKILGI